jgi:hypothetical protein
LIFASPAPITTRRFCHNSRPCEARFGNELGPSSRKLKNGPLLGLLRLFRGLRLVSGGHGIVADPQSWPDARAPSRRSHLIFTRSSAGAHWLWPAFAFHSERSPSDAHPLARLGSRRRHCDRSRALRCHVLATALLLRINRRTQSTTSPTRHHTSGPTCRLPDADTACRATRARLAWSSSSLEVFAPSALTGNARVVRGGRPPDDPASAFHPDPPARATAAAFATVACPARMTSTRARAVFRFRRIPCDEAHVADALGPLGVPAESVARRSATFFASHPRGTFAWRGGG